MDKTCQKRITTKDLFQYIKNNSDTFKYVNCVDLNDTSCVDIIDTLDQLNFQDLKKVNYLPPTLANIFKLNSSSSYKYFHLGVLNLIDKHNVTLFSSIISCLKHTFISYPISQQILFIEKFIKRLASDSKGHKYNMFGYKRYNWKKTDLYNDITNNLFNSNIIKYISDYLHINIFILDIDKDALYFGGGETYVPFKKTIFLLKYKDDSFEPFFTEQLKTFTVNDNIVKIIRNNISVVKCYILSTNIEFANITFEETEENLQTYKLKNTSKQFDAIDVPKNNTVILKNNNSDNSDDSEEDNQFDESTEKPHKYIESDIKATLKVVELQEIAKNLNIDISENKNGKKKSKNKRCIN